MENVRKIAASVFYTVIAAMIFCLVSCSDATHIHTFDTKWSNNETHHWHAATCEHTNEVADKAAHTWNAGEISVEPTEDSEGIRTFTCTVCDATKTEPIAKLEHVHIYDTTKWISDETSHWHATSCGHTDLFSDKANHTETIETKGATCTESGKKTTYCSVCEYVISTEEIPAKGHTWDNGTVQTEATEEHDGKTIFTCTACGATEIKTTPKLTHTHTFDTTKWEKDETYHWHVASCGNTEHNDKYEHIWDSGSETTPATEDSEGVMTFTCTECGQTKTKPIDKLPHTHKFDMTSWEKDETYHWHKATCDHKNEVWEKGTHTWDNGKVTQDSTENNEGIKTFNCSTCGKTRTEPIEKKEATLKGQLNSVANGGTIDFNAREIKVDDNGTYIITKPITIKNGDVKNATFIVQNEDVVFEGLSNITTITVSEKIRDGEFTLKNCGTVNSLYVNGGGETNAIHIEGTKIEKLITNKKNVGIALKKGSTSTSSRTAFSNDTTTEIAEMYALKSVQVESDDEENSIGCVAVAKTTQSLTFTGSTSVNEIISANNSADEVKEIAALTNADDFTINVSPDTKIESIDNVYSEENLKAARSATTTTFEDKSDKKTQYQKDLKTEQENANKPIDPDFTIDMTGKIPSAYLAKSYPWEGAVVNIANYGAYDYHTDITKLFSELPKKGDTVSVNLKANISEPIPLFFYMYEMDENYQWTSIAENEFVEDSEIDENGNFTINAYMTFVNTPKDHISFSIGYWKGHKDDHVMFDTGSEPKGKLYEIDVSDLLPGTSFNWWPEEGNRCYGVTVDISSKFPDVKKLYKDDIVQYTISSKINNDIAGITTACGSTWLTKSMRNIKANTPFTYTIEGRVGYDINFTANETLTLLLRYDRDDCDKASIFVSENSEIHDLGDISDLLPGNSFGHWDDYYYSKIDISSKLPSGTKFKKGDILKFNFTGILSVDVNMLGARLAGSETWLDGRIPEIAKNIKAFEPFTASGECIFGDTPKDGEEVKIQINYDETDCNKAGRFYSNDLHVYDIGDISDLLPGKEFDLWEGHYYYLEIDISSKLPSGTVLKKGDLFKFNFKGTLDADVNLLKASIRADKTWLDAEIPEIARDIKASTEFTASGECFIGATAEEDERFSIELEYTEDVSDKAAKFVSY